MKIVTIRPSSAFAEEDDGSVINVNKKYYQIVGRDIVNLFVVRVYWFDFIASWVWRKLGSTNRSR